MGHRPIHLARSSLSLQPLGSIRASSSSPVPKRYAIVGAGFAGVAVTWHLLYKASQEGRKGFHVDLFDAYGIAAGASGAAAGLLHPYTPRGKVLWNGIEAFEDALRLVGASELARHSNEPPFVWRNGLLRLAKNPKMAKILVQNAQNDSEALHLTKSRLLSSTSREFSDLVPGLSEDFLGSVPKQNIQGLYIGKGLVLDPTRYLQALWRSCCALGEKYGNTAAFHQRMVTSLSELERDFGGYDAIIVTIGAALESITETSGVVKLDLCQGYSLELESTKYTYASRSPSLLGSPYAAFHGECKAIVGATQNFGSSIQEATRCLGPTCNITTEKASTMPEVTSAIEELMTGIVPVWPKLRDWELVQVKSGVRALPTRTPQGSIPYAGKLAKVPENSAVHWFVSGLGARGLVYHAWLGRLVASAVMNDDDSILPKELLRWKIENTEMG